MARQLSSLSKDRVSRLATVTCLVLAALVPSLTSTQRALAQGCHVSDLPPDKSDLPLRMAVVAAFASYRNAIYAGEYQGYFAAASYSHPWFSAHATFGAYRIVRNGLTQYGVSDVALDARATLFRLDEAMALGLELAATLPTGDPARSLGMGHVMLMPGAFFELRRPNLRLLLQLAYGRVVGEASGHTHVSGPGPLVNPMNRSEIEHSASLSYQFHSPVFAATRLFGAVPIGAKQGAAREAIGMGLGASISRFELLAEVQLPLVGDPFRLRTQLSASVAF